MKAMHTAEENMRICIAAYFDDSELYTYKDFIVPKLYDLLMHRKFAAITLIEADNHQSYSQALAAYNNYNEQICIFLGISLNK